MNRSSLTPLRSLFNRLSLLGSRGRHGGGEGGWLSGGGGPCEEDVGGLGCGAGHWEGEGAGLDSGDGHCDGEGGGLGSGDGHWEGEAGGLGSGDGHWEARGGGLGSGDGQRKGEGGGLGSGDGVGLLVVGVVAVARCWKRGSWGMFLSLQVYRSDVRPAHSLQPVSLNPPATHQLVL